MVRMVENSTANFDCHRKFARPSKPSTYSHQPVGSVYKYIMSLVIVPESSPHGQNV